MDEARYRADIDGLRTVAVLAVVLFHLDVPSFGGGYVGVDVFFVISGFLITRLIADEFRDTGRFSFARFYIRRVRRLFPALFSTCLVSLVLATLLFSPEYMERFAKSVSTAILSVSNFYFWAQADYFDTEAQTKPLLHTWSLSVEEQFYLLWPALLVLLLTKARPRTVAAALILISLASLAVAQLLLVHDPNAAFYLLPARIVEFMLGAAVVWLIRERPVAGLLAEGFVLAGLGLIAYAVFFFTPATLFPGLASLVPCAGAALVIYAGQARFSGSLLRLPPVVAIGRWSYSIYLVHWPLLVFYGAYTFAETTAAEKAALAALSVGLGWLQYRFVEERFRHESRARFSRPQFAMAVAGCAALLIAPSVAISSSDGWKGRIPPERQTMTNKEFRNLETRIFCKSEDPAKPVDLFTCQNYRKSPHDIFIWGDSHARHLVAGFSHLYPEHNIFVAYQSGCVAQSGFSQFVLEIKNPKQTQDCVERNQKALAFFKAYKPSLIVISNAKRGDPKTIAAATQEILAALSSTQHQVVVLGDFIRPGRHLVNCTSVPQWLISDEHIARRCTGDPKKMREELAYNEEMASLLTSFVNPNQVQCPQGRCVYLEGTRLLYRDDHHLTTEGSALLLGRMKEHLPSEHALRLPDAPMR